MILRELTVFDQAVFERSLGNWDDLTGFSVAYEFFRDKDFQVYVNFLKSSSTGAHFERVFFAFLGDEIIGKVNLRPRLFSQKENIDGDIGYGIAPAFQGKGHGTQILRLSLDICRDLGLERVLLVCDRKNVASIKVIEKNGGQLETMPNQESSQNIRFWIKI